MNRTRAATMTRKPYPKRQLADLILHHPASLSLGSSPHQGCLWWRLRFDGGVDGNGQAWARGRWAFVLDDLANNRRVRAGSDRATGNPVTVNTCEWEGLLNGLQAAAALPMGTLCGLLIEGDSDLVISQLTGVWAAKAGPLIEWRDKCLDVLAELYVAWYARWIPREQNTECDYLTRGER